MHVRTNRDDLPARELEVLGTPLRIAGDSVKGFVLERFVIEIEPRVDNRDPEALAIDRRIRLESPRCTQPHDVLACDGIEELLEFAGPHDAPDAGNPPCRSRLIWSGLDENSVEYAADGTDHSRAGGFDPADDGLLRAFDSPGHQRVTGSGEPARDCLGTRGTRLRQALADREGFQNDRVAMR